MYGTCEILCRELVAKYPGDTPLMLVVWSPEEIQALADGMDISLTDHEIRTVLARLEDIPEDQRIESGISSGAAMEIISNVSENRQVTVPAELLASLIQTAEQALWKREWAARNALPAVRRWLFRPAPCGKTTHTKTTDVIAACGWRFRETMNHERNAECTDLSPRQ